MTVERPALLVAGLLLVLALAVAVVRLGRRRTAVLTAAGMVAPRARRPGLWLTLAGLAVLALAAAGPVAAIPVPRAAGTVVLAIDTSNSMGADDVDPTRLAAAQEAALAFIAAQPTSVDIGLVAFQEGALTTAQPSADHTAAADAVQRLTVSGGTSIGEAILTALSAITGSTVTIGEDGTVPDLGYWGSATIVLFSDGEETGGATDAATAAAVAQAAGVHIETVGVGTTAGTTVEVDGYQLQTALDAETLQTIAQTTDGSYHALDDAAELDDVADSIDLRLEVSDEELPLAGALSALAAALLAVGAVLTVLRTGRIV
ncbi:MAG TPA: VWA domain-containing protein [Cellulomonas sp.]